MKLTEQQLKQIIKEELNKELLREGCEGDPYKISYITAIKSAIVAIKKGDSKKAISDLEAALRGLGPA